MFKVSISNSKKNKLWEAKFASEELAQAWLAQQVGKPHRLPEQQVFTYDENGNKILDQDGNPVMEVIPAEFTAEVIDITSEYELEQTKIAARKLLADTDWMIIRELDSGVACPPEVKIARQAAREIL
jgi:hypothetical protein